MSTSATDRAPYIEWRSDGLALERVVTFHECSRRDEKMSGYDGYGRVTWRCDECRAYGGHQSVTKVAWKRRPEYDAPRPGSLENE